MFPPQIPPAPPNTPGPLLEQRHSSSKGPVKVVGTIPSSATAQGSRVAVAPSRSVYLRH